MTYVFALTDPDAPSRDHPKWSEFCHWIASGTPTLSSSGALSFHLKDLIKYKPPGPPPKTGKHRYVFIAFVPANGTIDDLKLTGFNGPVAARFDFRGKTASEGGMAMPIVIPEICMGVAMLVFFARIMPWPQDLIWPFNLGPIVIAHISFSFPFVAVVVRARLASFDRSQEEAARDLGATDAQAFRDVLIPHLKPSLIAGALLAFTLSLDDFVITFFTAGPDTITFPVKVYSMVRFSVTPEVNAASTLLIVLTVLLTVVALRFQNPKEVAGA